MYPSVPCQCVTWYNKEIQAQSFVYKNDSSSYKMLRN